MTYSTKTQSHTTPGRYHVRQILSHWKNRQKTNRRQKTEAKSCHALGSSQTTILPLMLPKLGSRLCCRLQLSWHPVNRSSEGDIHSCCIVIAVFNVGIAWKKCIKGTAPSSWNVVDSRTQPLGPNGGLCCRCRCRVEIGITCCTVARPNWRHSSVAMLTSARQTKWKC